MSLNFEKLCWGPISKSVQIPKNRIETVVNHVRMLSITTITDENAQTLCKQGFVVFANIFFQFCQRLYIMKG